MMHRLTLLAALACLAGCNALSGPRANFAIHDLDPAISPGRGAPQAWQLLIEPPHASDLLDGTRIVVAGDDNERLVYPGARWAERTPSLLQSVWLRAFETDGRLPGVARAGSGVRADLILATDLSRFQASRIRSEPVVEVQVHARLVDPAARRIVARRVFASQQPIGGDSATAIVAGFEAALAEINPALVDWTLERGRAALQAPPRP